MSSGLTVEPDGITVGERSFPAGEILTVDGDRGVVLLGDHPSDEIEVDEVRHPPALAAATSPAAQPA